MGPGERGASIDDLVDRAVEAINRGDRAAATALAGQVLAVDRDNADAEDESFVRDATMSYRHQTRTAKMGQDAELEDLTLAVTYSRLETPLIVPPHSQSEE